ncbi:protein stoned-A isoform X2 [Folsomia candida]|uniref:protein stoned-A isoform X2 n=1 Tax=Folsomia candida TaxID=158441 RepID=UPI001604DA71|nr:protein stoned-A isoform X2 [Folsomia candida]
MLKGVKKGLKKIKGKKHGKADEDDLFDPEQLEKLKRELEEKRKAEAAEGGESSSHNGGQQAAASSAAQDEEWAKFKLLTAGVDTVLNKATEELGKIKETSFFQRVVTDPTNLWRPDKGPGAPVVETKVEEEVEVPVEEEIPEEPVVAPEDVEPVELDDSLFDTAYLDAIAAGEIKLAYIPDSPTEEEGDDPFDTSGVADVVKRIEEAEKKAKRQVNLGSAASFLSGKGATEGELDNSRARPRAGGRTGRARPRAVNLLGDSENAPAAPIFESASKKEEQKDIFDDLLNSEPNDALPLPELESCILASTSPVPSVQVVKSESPTTDKAIQDILGEFDDILAKAESSSSEPPTRLVGGSADYLRSILEPEEDLDDEFAALASESLAKSPLPVKEEEAEAEPEEDDPFDTTFVEKVVVEEKEVEQVELKKDDDDDFDFDPRADEPARLTPPPQSLLDDHSPTGENLPTLELQFRAKAATGHLVDHAELKAPGEKETDPFDTSTVKVVLPGRAELKLLEEELLNAEVAPLTAKIPHLPAKFSAPAKPVEPEDDFDFNPRSEEEKPDHPFDQGDEIVNPPLADSEDHRVLIPQQEEEAELDPFDTSCVAGLNLGPGQLELKLLESELVSRDETQHPVTAGTSGLEQLEDDFDFDPRGDEEPDPFVVVVKQGILKTEDIFGDHEEEFIGTDKPLIPQQEGVTLSPKPLQPENQGDHDDDVDPFDTSSIEVIKLLPPSELKAIEAHLISAPEFSQTAPQIKLKAAFSAPAVPQTFVELKPQLTVDEEAASEKPHLLEEEDPFHLEIEHKPLTPLEIPDFDPFDTSIAEGVIPGKTEIRVLEQELQLGFDGLSGRRLSDPDFDPRGATVVKEPQPIHPAALSYVSKILEPTRSGSLNLGADEDDVDPFDTSAADNFTSNIGPPVTALATNQQPPDLKALEAELL